MSKSTKNMISKEEFIETIKAELAKQTQAWRVIAKQFALAFDQFGSDSDAYKAILKATGFNEKTAYKLTQIGNDSRLTDPAFERVVAWTVLYEISLMSDDEIQTLKAQLSSFKSNGIPTAAMVKKIRFPETKEADPYQSVFNIRIDKNALKSSKFDGSAYETLVELIAQIQDTVPYVRVDETDLYENETRRELAEIDRVKERIVREKVVKAISVYKKESSEWKSFKSAQRKGQIRLRRPMLAYWRDEEEIFEALKEKDGYVQIFQELKSPEDGRTEADFFNEAQERVTKKREKKFGRLANKQFAHANTISSSSAELDVSYPPDWKKKPKVTLTEKEAA